MKIFLLVPSLLFLLVACQVESLVSVNVEDNGSGSVEVIVELDDEASRIIGDIEKQLRTDDLVAAGWEVSTLSASEEESKTVVLATKSFTGVDSLVGVLEEVAGPSVFSEVKLVSEKSFAKKYGTSKERLTLRMAFPYSLILP